MDAKPTATSESVRVAAAAMVAEQLALDQRERLLCEREAALAAEQAQVAQRLAERSRQVDELQQQLAAARDQFRHEREQLAQMREQIVTAHRETLARRDRLRELRERFTRRLKARWSAVRQLAEQRLDELDHRRRQHEDNDARLRNEQQALQRERNEFEEERQRERREAQSRADALAEAEARLADERVAMNAEHQRREQELAAQARRIDNARQRLDAALPALEKRCEDLRAEARGLEQRVTSARRRLIEQESAPRASPAPLPHDEPLPASLSAQIAGLPEPERSRLTSYYRDCQALVRTQAADLADQRAHLAEMYERLTRAEAEWHNQQAAAIDDMERVSRDLEAREDALRARHRETEAGSERLRQERDALARRRATLERGVAESALRQSAWESERAQAHAELRQREQVLRQREQALTNLFRRWRERRRQEIVQFHRLSRTCLESRTAWSRASADYLRRSDSLRRARQGLAAQALALEEARAVFLAAVEPAGAAAKRLERLRRRWDGLAAAARRELDDFRQRLADEDTQLRHVYTELERQQEQLVQRERALAQQATELENERRLAGQSAVELGAARQAWEDQRRDYERQLDELRALTRRLAQRLNDDAPPAMRSAA